MTKAIDNKKPLSGLTAEAALPEEAVLDVILVRLPPLSNLVSLKHQSKLASSS